MNFIYIYFCFLLFPIQLFSQPRNCSNSQPQSSIDTTAIDSWPIMGNNVSISNDGKFFCYNIVHGSQHTNSLTVQSIQSSWKAAFEGARNGVFSEDSRKFIFQASDTINFVDLYTKNITFETGVQYYQYLNTSFKRNILVYLKKIDNEFVVRDLSTGSYMSYKFVQNFSVSENQNGIVLQLANERHPIELIYLNLLDLKTKLIWRSDSVGSQIKGLAVSPSGRKVAFIVDTSKNYEKVNPNNSIYIYVANQRGFEERINICSSNIRLGFVISDSNPRFSKDENNLYFDLQREKYKVDAEAVQVDVWSHNDTTTQPSQLAELELGKKYTAVANLITNRIFQVETDYEKIFGYSDVDGYLIVTSDYSGSRLWLGPLAKQSLTTYWLFSLANGSKTMLPVTGSARFWFSPYGKILLYFDASGTKNYYSYHLSTGKIKNVTRKIPSGLLAFKDEFLNQAPADLPSDPIGVAAWLTNSSEVLVYDNFDVWKIDLEEKKDPVNITNNFGRRNSIKLRLTFGMDVSNKAVILKPERLLLTAFGVKDKYNGFFLTSKRTGNDPEKLTFGPYAFYLRGNYMLPLNSFPFDYNLGFQPLKAKNSPVWIVKRQTTADAPNYYLTYDFKRYRKLTNLNPKLGYSWCTAELVSFKQRNGINTQGILYKPENFDSLLKYPVLINYYQQLSHRLYQFPSPEYTGDNISVSWFVSRGYLVFTPDIYNSFGEEKESALSCMLGIKDWLSQLIYVDSTKIGINGHSIGGGLTNYIISHSNAFAAALEGAGVSNQISSALGPTINILRVSRTYSDEVRLGFQTIWQNPKKYLENSAVLKANEINTPLLILHCKNDDAMPWQQGVELFNAMYRLNKPVWLLQYDHGYHTVEGKDAKDFTIRVTQFFDHYLKLNLPPVWMTHGIPARLKGLVNGYELDSVFKCSQSCIVCNKRITKRS